MKMIISNEIEIKKCANKCQMVCSSLNVLASFQQCSTGVYVMLHAKEYNDAMFSLFKCIQYSKYLIVIWLDCESILNNFDLPQLNICIFSTVLLIIIWLTIQSICRKISYYPER